MFLDKLIADIQNNKYFLCASDSATKITKLFNHCIKYGTDKN